MGWYAVYRREMLLLWKKIGRMGYIFPSIISPFIYFFAFGLGLGGRVNVEGGYIPFLASGIIGMTVMTNGFQQTASSVSAGRLYFRHFHSLILSPVSHAAVWGIVLAGMRRAVIFSSLILAVDFISFGAGIQSSTWFAGILLGGFCFSSLGMVAGMLVRQVDDISLVNSFFITHDLFWRLVFSDTEFASLAELFSGMVSYRRHQYLAAGIRLEWRGLGSGLDFVRPGQRVFCLGGLSLFSL